MSAPSYEDLQEQVRYLRDRLADVTGQSAAVRVRVATGLTNRQSQIVAMLNACPGVVSAAMLYDGVFANTDWREADSGPDTNAIKTQICLARTVLKKAGAPEQTIRHDFNFGYYLTTEFRTWLRDRMAAPEMAVAA